MHDRLAELAGLRTELAICENGPNESRRQDAGGVRQEITRVRDELDAEAEKFEARAEELAAGGQDVPAAEAAVAAREIRSALDNDDQAPAKARPAGTSGKRNTAAAKAPNQS